MTTQTAPMASPTDSHDSRRGHTPLYLIFLLGLSFAVAGLAGAGLALWLWRAGVALPALLAASAGVALLLGLALSGLLLVRLAQLDHALAQLAAGATGADAALPSSVWPLDQLLWRVEAAHDRIAQVAERERLALAYRDELMRQVGEAAAREERNRLARELHDSIKQQLFSIGVSAAAARARASETDATGATAALDDIARGAHEAQVEMTALLQQLRPAPLENVGLVEALRDQCEALGYRTGAEVSISVGALPDADRLPPRTQEQLFRMAQEALANIARHARAQHVWLRLERQGDAILLEARDDGQGFDPAQASGGMGLSNLRERAQALGGSVELRSAPGQGTTVRIHVPLIESLRLSPEEAARQATVVATRRAGERWETSALSMLQITGALVIFGAPFWADALAFVAACALLALGLPLRREVTRLADPNGVDALALRHRAIEVSAWLLMLLALAPWYALVVAPRGWLDGSLQAAVIAASALLLALGLWQWERWRRTTVRYYRLLAPRPRRQAIQRRWNETVGVLVTLGVVIAVAPFVGGWSPAFPPRTPAQWSDTSSLALLALVGLFCLIELSLNWRWRRAAERSSERVESEVGR